MSSKENKTPLIFDLDGTLWDSCLKVQEAWNLGLQSWMKQTAYQRPLLTLDEVQGIMGLAFDEIFAKLFPDLPLKLQRELGLYLEEFEAEVLGEQGGVLYEGVESGLIALAQIYPLGIISNCQAGYIEIFLKSMDTFSLADFKSHGATQKPKFQNIVNMLHEQGWDRAVYLGDTLKDYESCLKAREMGCSVEFHLAEWGFGSEDVLKLNPKVPRWSSFSDFSQDYL